jgi:uncharacterized protein (DUF2249 family)
MQSHNEKSPQIIDVRKIAPCYRHSLIFQTFDELQPGETFILVNDHVPTPLYHQFLHERADLFKWNYLEEGPNVWRIQIGKQ